MGSSPTFGTTNCVERPSPDRITRYVLTGVTARAEMSDQRLSGSVTLDETIDQHTVADIPDIEGLDAFFVREEGVPSSSGHCAHRER